MQRVKSIHWIYLLIILIITIWSAIDSFEPWLWWLEASLCIFGVAILVFFYKRFPLTDITYFFIVLHIIVLLVGAHYSYARVPLFNWIGEMFDMERNNYDKVGHFMQGFVPAFIAREIIIRLKVVNKKNWIPFFVICISLSISALYELVEWWVAELSTTGADDFLGTQGYEWDTQSDMLMAMIGAICMLIFFSKIQNKQIEKLENDN